MELKDLTPELLDQARLAASADDLLTLAAENNIDLSSEEAHAAFAKLHPDDDLADDELENVSGGKMIKVTKGQRTKPFGPC